MATDPTTAEKAERLGLVWLRGPDCWADATTGATRISRDEPGGDWIHFEDWRRWDTDVAAIAALYAERFPAPDYRAALERLVDVAEQIENAGPGHEDWGALTKAIAHARKVLHGQ